MSSLTFCSQSSIPVHHYQCWFGVLQGQCFIAVDPSKFFPGFEGRLEDFLQMQRNLDPSDPSKPVLVAGDPERIHMKKCNDMGGIPYPSQVVDFMVCWIRVYCFVLQAIYSLLYLTFGSRSIIQSRVEPLTNFHVFWIHERHKLIVKTGKVVLFCGLFCVNTPMYCCGKFTLCH